MMGDPIPGEDDNAADGINPIDNGSAERAGADSSPIDPGPAKPVSEPPPPPPLLPGQEAQGGTEAEQSPDGPAYLAQWLKDWAEERAEAMEEGRTTRKISGPEPLNPPVGTGPPAVPIPPPVRTPLPNPPVGDRPVAGPPVIAGSWAGPSHDAPGTMVTSGAAGSEVTENDIARLARTTSSSVLPTRNVKLGRFGIKFGSQRSMAVVGVLAMTLLVVLTALFVSRLGVDRSESTSAIGAREATVKDDDDFLVSGPPPAAPNVSELARSTVRVVGLDSDDEVVCVGSGIIVGVEGIILTNAQVATVGERCDIASIGIGVATEGSETAELLYLAEALVSDENLDLAVLRIVSPLPTSPTAPFPRRFPAVTLGDSDDVQLGDSIRILGYPHVDGEMITPTTGSVGGFSSQPGVGERAWINTDASVSGGASGGMAFNEAGEVIGIPTKDPAGADIPAAECDSQEDVEGDGGVAADEDCQANGVRPINLASDVLDRAEAIIQASGQGQPGAGSFELSDVLFSNPRFSPGEQDNQPVEDSLALREGVTDVCLFVDWAGIPDGVSWTAVWLVDGNQIEDFGRLDQVWDFGKDGRNFWYCANDENGHKPGVYEMGLFIDYQLVFVESIQILEDDADVFEVTWLNKSDADICGLAVNPLADSRHVGLNELEADVVIRAGQSHTMAIPEGDIVVEAFDCSGLAIAAELDGLNVPDEMFVDGEMVPFVIGGDVQAGQSDQGG